MIAPTTNTKRVVATGMFGPRAICLNVHPDFGTQDEWAAAMSSAVDAAPEYYTKLLDDDWLVEVEAEITRNPWAIAFAVEPKICGMYDAQMGLPDEALARGYRTVGDALDYLAAWRDTDAAMRAMAADSAEYVDWNEDISWIRGGM